MSWTTGIILQTTILVMKPIKGVGDILPPKLIVEIGDVRRFYSGKALVAYAVLDAPPYQSG